ncbi:uncharacterized protein LOC142240690 [Haematobia irritans]|uniref:uncharacterized protein LOC142240690 n=1 Tax=Haematobia irritans TaxID=7368 RepID=UPI003F507335
MKFNQLRVEDLKKELSKMEQPTTGNKAQLQKRLLEEFERRSIDIETHEFDYKEDLDESVVASALETPSVASNVVDYTSMVNILSKMMEENSLKMQENSRKMMEENSLKMQENSRKMMEENSLKMQENSRKIMEENSLKMQENSRKLEETFDENSKKMDENSRILNENLQQIAEGMEKRVDHIESQIGELDKKIISVDEKIMVHDEKFLHIERKMSELEIKGGPVRVIEGSKTKPPVFDGSTSFDVFKFQFEMVACRNLWNDNDKAIELLLALKGNAADVIQSIPAASRNNYNEVIAALQRKYGGEHKQDIFRMELRGRVQKSNETLQDFATEVERLVLLTYPGESHPLVDRIKIETFVNGIRDPDIKCATYASQKATFAETVTFAHAQETARLLARPQIHKVRRVETQCEETQSVIELVKEALRQIMQEMKQQANKSRIKCYNCDKAGHLSRECKAWRKTSGSISPSPLNNNHKKATTKPSDSNLNFADNRKGGKQVIDQALTRRHCNVESTRYSKAEPQETVVNVRQLHIESGTDWSTEQRKDPILRKIISAKEEDKKPSKKDIAAESPLMKSYWAQWDSLCLVNGTLQRKWESEDGKNSRNLIIVPDSKVNDVLTEFHNGPSGGHLGITKTAEKVKQRFYWVGCQKSIAEWVANCEKCIKAKGPRRKSRGLMQEYRPGAPFERIAMDVARPFPVSDSGNRYVLVVMDYFSKWPEVYAIPNQEAKTIVDVVDKNWICRYGVPTEIHSDQGRNFESAIFKEMCDSLGIKKTRTTPLHPQSDGMVERFNRTLEEHLRKVVDNGQRDWDDHIPKFLLSYRSAIHDSTSRTPAKVLFGTEFKLPGDLIFGATPNELAMEETSNDIPNTFGKVHESVRNKIKMVSNRMKARYDRAANTEGFSEGQLVLLFNPQRKKGLCPKLQTQWEGPYKVIKKINDVVYRIQKDDSPRSKMKVVHLERLAPYGTGSVPIRDEQA